MSPASAQNFTLTNQVLEIGGVDSGGVDVTTAKSGSKWRYTIGYSLSGAADAGVVITANFPAGIWYVGSSAPAGFTEECVQDPADIWDWSCTWTATDLDVSGLAGAISVEVRSRHFFWHNGSTVELDAVMDTVYDNGGGPASAVDQQTASHEMAITATGSWSIDAYTVNAQFTYAFFLAHQTMGPADEPGYSFWLRGPFLSASNAKINAGAKLVLELPTGVRYRTHALAKGWSTTATDFASGEIQFTLDVPWRTAKNVGVDGKPNITGPFYASGNIQLWVPCSTQANSPPVVARLEGTFPEIVNGLEVATPLPAFQIDVPIKGNACAVVEPSLKMDYQGQAAVSPEKTINQRLAVWPRAGIEQHVDAVVWTLIPKFTRYLDYISPLNGVLNYGQDYAINRPKSYNVPPDFQGFGCRLSPLDNGLSSAQVRSMFLTTWMDDMSVCTPLSGTASKDADITHVFYHAPVWGPDPGTAEAGDFVESFFAVLSVVANAGTPASPLPGTGEVLSTKVWFADAAMAATLPDPTIKQVGGGLTVESDTEAVFWGLGPLDDSGIAPPVDVVPGESKLREAAIYFKGAPAENPFLECVFPAGANVATPPTPTWGCVGAAADKYPAPSPWPAPEISLLPDGSTLLKQTSGDASAPVAHCTSHPMRLDYRFTVTIDEDTLFTDGQELEYVCAADADNQANGPTEASGVLVVRVPPEMTLLVLPTCKAEGELGFSAIFENTGGQPLTDVSVEFPIADVQDPGGAPFDDVEFVSAAAFDPFGGALVDAVIEYRVAGVWQGTAPVPASLADSVRVNVPSLLPVSGPHRLVVKIAEAAANPGNGLIYATGQMESAQLANLSTLTDVPFVVGTCPALISVHKFFDADEDALQSDGEVNLHGWVFEVRDDSDAVVNTLKMGGTGQAFASIATAGDYTVSEVMPTNDPDVSWRATTPLAAPSAAQAWSFGASGGEFYLDFGNTCDCDDGDACTANICTPTGCSHPALAEDEACDSDQNLCTLETCVASVCTALEPATIPCGDDAACTPLNGAFQCDCVPGYAGDGQTCTDIDECDDGTHNCDVNATCTNTVGSFECACNPGYTGDGVICTDIDECTEGTHDCGAGALCTNTDASFTCACAPGYTGDGYTCTDVDECEQDIDGCDVNAVCTNSDGSFDCDCNEGYGGDGMTCTDVDECVEETHGCDADRVCENTVGSFDCVCAPGYNTVGDDCVDIDECVEDLAACGVGGTCANTPGGFDCDCEDGYEVNGNAQCVDVDECLAGDAPCGMYGQCVNIEGSFQCTCDAGYASASDGAPCVDIDECAADAKICGDLGTCTNIPGSYDCACLTGYTYTDGACSDTDECTENSHDCGPGAVCNNTTGSFECTCGAGFEGDGTVCVAIDECAANPESCGEPPTAGCSCDTTNHNGPLPPVGAALFLLPLLYWRFRGGVRARRS